jgi:hypothetical protein
MRGGTCTCTHTCICFEASSLCVCAHVYVVACMHITCTNMHTSHSQAQVLEVQGTKHSARDAVSNICQYPSANMSINVFMHNWTHAGTRKSLIIACISHAHAMCARMAVELLNTREFNLSTHAYFRRTNHALHSNSNCIWAMQVSQPPGVHTICTIWSISCAQSMRKARQRVSAWRVPKEAC